MAAALAIRVQESTAAEASEEGQVSSAASEVISWMFERGVEEYDAGNYKDAVIMFDGILAIDKYNGDAIAYKKRAANRITKNEAKQIELTRANAIAEVSSAWNQEPRVFGAVSIPGESDKVDPYQLAVEQMEARMRAITIPSLDFSNSNVEDVLLFLSAASRRLKGQGEDVDIALLGMEYATGESTVSISFAEMNLYEALSLVVEMTSLKLEVRPSVVAVMPANYIPASQIITRSYDVSADVGMDFESMADAGGGADDLFGDSFAAEAVTGPIDVAGFFAVVDFPTGASAVYQPRFNKLFVKNTEANLEAVEDILAGLEEEAAKLRSQQVEIEAKFVEFNEGALEELGFDWTVYGSGSIAGMEMKDGDYFQEVTGYTQRTAVAPTLSGANATYIYTTPVTGQKLITEPNDRQGQNFFGAAQRSNTSVFDPVATGILSTMGGNPAAMAFADGNVDLRITAMEQQGTADVLSSPKVTTKSGNEALIRIAETHRYPQDYEVVTGQRTAPVVQPQDWEDFDMGVSLKVTPVVDTESGTIDLELYPQIMQFKGYDPYIVGYNAYDAGGNNSSAPGGDGSTLFAQMPYFNLRSAQTQVTIADGSTVVMGGLVDERTETFRDQVPIIGDIPYLGRLFRTEGSRNVKKNLTIFVKTTQIDARGMTRLERELARQ
jgi:general secretion pathway protein D